MVIELQLVLQTITKIPQCLNILDLPFMQGPMSSKSCISLCIHQIALIFLILIFFILPAKSNIERYGCISSLSTVSQLQGMMAPERCCVMLPHFKEEGWGHGWYGLDQMFAEQEPACNEVWADADPCVRVQLIFGIEWQGYRSFGEFLPFTLEWLAPAQQLSVSSCICKGTSIHSLTSPVSHYVYMYSPR
jgi:hypothetical protein